ncbi:MAG: glycoside hydrolase family 3 N-terminal domain-containing protein, partial [Dermabacter sp.]|nr:glycoside hydrolase family 3 N-terminal domain-containing protein [Dermabacter sp.]
PVIGARSFGTSPGLVARHARAVCEGLSRAGVLSCAKHFPGHGDTAVDSHLGVPTVALSREDALAQHVAAFHELGSAPDALITGHMCVPSLGEGPATIAPWSYALAAQINPDALLVTDALDMGAITESVGYAEAAVQALDAGAHLLCLGTSIRRDGENMLVEAHDAIAEALRSGRLDRDELRSRAERVRTTFAGRASASACTVEALENAEAHLEAVGERASRRAVRWALESSPVAGHVSTAAIVDARFAHDYAAGKGRTFLAPVLEHRGIRLLPADPPPGYESPQVTFVLTRLGSASDAETARLDQAAAHAHELGSRLIVLHTGVPETAPLPHTLSSPAAVLLTYGASRGVMNAAADLALGEVAR